MLDKGLDFSAKSAKEIADMNKERFMQREYGFLMEKIRDASSHARYSVTFGFKFPDNIDKVEDMGYKVKQIPSYSDDKDIKFTISWD